MKLWIDAVIGISVFHRIWEAVIQAVAGAAANHLIGIVHDNGVLGVQIRKDPAFVSEVIAALRRPPLHNISLRLMVG